MLSLVVRGTQKHGWGLHSKLQQPNRPCWPLASPGEAGERIPVTPSCAGRPPPPRGRRGRAPRPEGRDEPEARCPAGTSADSGRETGGLPGLRTQAGAHRTYSRKQLRGGGVAGVAAEGPCGGSRPRSVGRPPHGGQVPPQRGAGLPATPPGPRRDTSPPRPGPPAFAFAFPAGGGRAGGLPPPAPALSHLRGGGGCSAPGPRGRRRSSSSKSRGGRWRRPRLSGGQRGRLSPRRQGGLPPSLRPRGPRIPPPLS